MQLNETFAAIPQGEAVRAVKTLENVTLVLASKFENFRELASKDSRT